MCPDLKDPPPCRYNLITGPPPQWEDLIVPPTCRYKELGLLVTQTHVPLLPQVDSFPHPDYHYLPIYVTQGKTGRHTLGNPALLILTALGTEKVLDVLATAPRSQVSISLHIFFAALTLKLPQTHHQDLQLR